MEDHLVYGQMQVGQTELCVKSSSNGKYGKAGKRGTLAVRDQGGKQKETC